MGIASVGEPEKARRRLLVSDLRPAAPRSGRDGGSDPSLGARARRRRCGGCRSSCRSSPGADGRRSSSGIEGIVRNEDGPGSLRGRFRFVREGAARSAVATRAAPTPGTTGPTRTATGTALATSRRTLRGARNAAFRRLGRSAGRRRRAGRDCAARCRRGPDVHRPAHRDGYRASAWRPRTGRGASSRARNSSRGPRLPRGP